MSGLDLFVDGFPHGTPQGYDEGCQGGTCPTGVEYGLSCKIAKSKSRGDYQYQKLVKQGATIPEIADALGLVGTATAPAKKKPTPTPATAQGGVSLADAATLAQKAMAPKSDDSASVVLGFDGATPDTTTLAVADKAGLRLIPDTEESRERSQKIWDETAARVKARNEPATETTTPAEAEPKKKVWEKKRPAPATDAADAKSTAPKPAEIREWARSRGYEVGSKGKLPQHIVEHYWEATGRLDSTSPAVDTIEPAADTEAPEPAIEIAQTVTEDTEPAEESLADPQEEETSTRPEWSTVAALADLEAARSIAVRLEQELAHITEELENARNEADSLAHQYLDEFGKVIKLAERLDQRTQERDRAEHLQRVAERATSLLLTKWGEERAANEASHALIVQQAHTINQLADRLSTQTVEIPIHGAPIDAVLEAGREIESRGRWNRR